MTSPGGYSAGTIFLQVVPSFRGFQEAIRQHAKAANKAFGDEMGKGAESTGRDVGEKIGKSADESVGAYATKMRERIDKAFKSIAKVKLDADSSAFDARLDIVRAQLGSLRDVDFSIKAHAEQAERVLDHVKHELKDIAMSTTDARVGIEAATAYAELKKLTLDLDRFGMKKAKATAEVDTDKARGGLRGLLNDFDETGSAMRGFNGILLTSVAIGPALVPILAAIAGGIGAIGPAAIAGAAGLGVMVLAFSGIQNAVSALNDVDSNVAKDMLANSKAMRTAAKGLRDANQGVARANEEAARSRDDSARRIQDALKTEARAERDLKDEQKAERNAQADLTKERQDAKKAVEDLSNSIAGGALAERQAVIDLFEATVAYKNAMADPGATNLEKEQASINLGNAKLSLKQIREQNNQLAQQQAAAHKTGIEGSAGVVAAHEKVAQAHQGVLDAQQRVTDAHQGVADAQKAAARAAVDSQLAVRDATERLGDAQAAYNEALTKTGVVGTASYQKLEQAMSMLGPAGRDFARFIYGLKGDFLDLKAAAQEGFLPGLQKGLQTLIKEYGPGLKAFVGDMAKVLGNMAEQAGKALTNPMWQRFFDMMATYGPMFLQMWGTIGGQLATIIANIMVAFAPLGKQLMQGFIDLLQQAVKWTAGLSNSKGFKDFIAYVLKVSPDVMAFFGNLVGALVNLGVALAPYAAQLLKILSGFLGWIAGMDPKTLGIIAIGITAVIIAIQAALGLVAAIGTIITAVGAIQAIGIAIEGAGAAIVGFLSVVGIFVLIGAALVVLYIKSKTFRDIVNGVFSVVGKVIGWFWSNIVKPIFGFIMGYLKRLWQFWSSVFQILWGIVKWAGEKIANIVSPWFKKGGWAYFMTEIWNDYVVPAWRAGIDAITSLWDILKNAAKESIKFVVDTVINDGLIDNFNWLAHKFGAKGVDRIKLPPSFYDQKPRSKAEATSSRLASSASGNGVGGARLATGGFVPGFSATPTADNIPAWLTAGEFVLPVKAVNRLRSSLGDDFLERLRQGDVPGYAGGGNVLSGIGNAIGSGASWVGGKVKDATGALLDPVQWLMRKVLGKVGDFAKTDFGQLVTSVPTKLVHMAWDAIKDSVGLGGGNKAGGGNKNAPASRQGNVDIVRAQASALGWGTGEMWDSLVALINSESGFNSNAQNPTSTAYGMFQFLDGTWGIKGISKTSDPALQTAAGLEYIRGRYGNPTNAWAFHKANNWYSEGGAVEAAPRYADGGPVLYDSGGYLPPGLTTVLNASGRPEPVLTAQQWDKIEAGGMGGGGDTFPMTLLNGPSPNEVAEEIMFRKRHSMRGGVYERSR